SIADIMKEYPTANFHIEGHTDSRGSDSYNLDLSKRRAASVREYLTSKGIPSSRLTSEGYGEARPIATNNTKAGRQQNRRVEISLKK
ncbi:MAG: OmpA family protein, partial [Flavobacteriaceae bacterium]|nr:OmpA family protein [Flavobacteriaceae bacterium]